MQKYPTSSNDLSARDFPDPDNPLMTTKLSCATFPLYGAYGIDQRSHECETSQVHKSRLQDVVKKIFCAGWPTEYFPQPDTWQQFALR